MFLKATPEGIPTMGNHGSPNPSSRGNKIFSLFPLTNHMSGSAEGSPARRGGRSIPRKGWDPFFPPGLDLPTQHSQRPLAAPALSQAILSEVLGRRPGRNGLSAVSEAQGQGLWTLAFASSWQTGHFASAIWKLLSAFALTTIILQSLSVLYALKPAIGESIFSNLMPKDSQ